MSARTIILQKRSGNTPSGKRPRQARTLTVRARPGKPTQGLLTIDGLVFGCALGPAGIRALKREGDGATPRAIMRVLTVFYRADRQRAGIGPVHLPVAPIRPDLGWCDAPADANYNRPVRLPYPGSHEKMWRADRLYNVCIVLDWNILPRRRRRGSAIFLHVARPGMEPTEGCIAVSPRTMARLLPLLTRNSRVVVL